MLRKNELGLLQSQIEGDAYSEESYEKLAALGTIIAGFISEQDEQNEF